MRNPVQGNISLVMKCDNFELFRTQALSKSKRFNKDGTTLHPFPLLTEFVRGPSSHLQVIEQQTKTLFPDHDLMPFYAEGGNQFLVSNSSGQPVLFLSRTQRDIVHLMQRKKNVFIEEAKGIKGKDLSDSQSKRILREMHSLGLLLIDERGGGLSVQDQVGVWIQQTRSRFHKWPNIDAVISSSEICDQVLGSSNVEKLPQKDALLVAEKHIKQRQLVHKQIGKFYQIPAENVVALPNLTYHLDSYFCTSSGSGGRGPTKDMSPLRMFTSWGHSSSENLRSSRPTGVTRGSHDDLNTGPSISLR